MGGSAPSQDPNMGKAALLSASTGQDMLKFMRDQATITNGWAATDRARYDTVFKPLENSMIADAKTYDSPQRKGMAAAEAVADVRQQSALEDGTQRRQMAAMGVSPASGRFSGETRRRGIGQALAAAGAGNMARRQVESIADGKMANVVNMGRGMAVNPATSMGLSNGAGQAGFGGAMQGYGQQGSILNQDYQNRMQAYQQSQAGIGGLLGGLGSLAGLAFGSSKEIKHDKQRFDALGAVREMPVEKWTYNPGEGDEGEHVGPYAEDFNKATGIGDGKSIDVISAVGITMGAVRQLDQKITALMKKMGSEDDDEDEMEFEGMGAVPMKQAA